MPVAKGTFLCENSNNPVVAPKFLNLAREPELIYCQCACVGTTFFQ